MTLASKWLDMVVGLDLHMEMVPTPVPTPTPFPHPFMGLVFDPVGMIMEEVIATVTAWVTETPPDPGKVWISGFPATVTGDAVSMPVPHILIPPGVSWAPIPRVPKPPVGLGGKLPLPEPPLPPPSDALLLMGAQSVKMMGCNAVRAGEIALSCSDPVRMPTSTVMSTGMSGLVTIGGPPGIDWQRVVLLAGMRALRTIWDSAPTSGLLAKIIPESLKRARNIAHKSGCFLTGHPVNVSTGSVLTDAIDFQLPGAIPVVFERNYNSTWFDRDSPAGLGWAHSLDQKVWIEEHCIVYLSPDGREVEFNTRELNEGIMRSGDTLLDPVNQLTLRSHGQFRWTLRRNDGVILEFGPVPGESPQQSDRGCARLQRMRTPAGNTVEFAYDPSAKLQQVTDCGGRVATFEHDPAGRLSRIWLPSPDGSGPRLQAQFDYDAQGYLIRARDAVGNATVFSYSRGLLVSETNRNGLAFFFKYDGWGRFARCIETWGIDPAGDGTNGIYHHLLDYDRKNRRTVVTNSLSQVVVYTYDGAFMVTSIVDAAGSETRFEYDHAHRPNAHVNALGQRTETTYDERGNRVMIAEPGKRVTKVEHDEDDRITAVVLPGGRRWTWTYDSAGRVVSRVDPLGHATTYRYERARLMSITGAAGATTRLDYNSSGDLISATDATGAERRWIRDALGRVVGAVDELGTERRSTFDSLGRVVRIEEPDGNVRELGYDDGGNLIRSRDRSIDIAFTYRGLDNVATKTVAGATIRYEYDSEDQLVAVVNERGDRHTFQLDARGQVASQADFGGMCRTFNRDALGRVTKISNSKDSATTEIEYDEAGRAVSVCTSNGPELSYQYGADGNLAEATADGVRTLFERDALGRVVLESSGDAWVRSAFDPAGRKIKLESSRGASLEFARDPVGALTRVAHTGPDAGWEAVFTRDSSGAEVNRQLPGNARSYWWRNETGLPTQHFVGKDSQTHRLRTYAWTLGERLSQIEEQGQAPMVFKHDARGRLSSVEHPTDFRELRNPDEVGNLFARADRTDREYGTAGQLLSRAHSEGSTTYRYDAVGNLSERTDHNGARWFFHHDGAGQLAQVDRADGKAVTFSYDAFGRRIAKNAAGVITRWQWDGDTPLHEWQERGTAPALIRTPQLVRRMQSLLDLRQTLRARLGDAGDAQWWARVRDQAETDFVAREVLADAEKPSSPGPDASPDDQAITWIFEPGTFSPLARLTEAGALSIVSDHLGTPLCMLDASGEARWQANHDSYGTAVISGDPELCPWRFPGQYHDRETELHYNRHRYYDPAGGGYISPDPIGLAGGLAQYGYVADPTTWIDPLGLSAQRGPCGGGGLGGAEAPQKILAARTTRCQVPGVRVEFPDAGTRGIPPHQPGPTFPAAQHASTPDLMHRVPLRDEPPGPD